MEHLKELTDLQRLDLRYTQITDVGLEDVSKLLPGCDVSHY